MLITPENYINPGTPVGFFKERKRPKAGNPRPKGKAPITRENVGLLIEDFFANEYSIRALGVKYNLGESRVNHYLSKMFAKQLNEDREIITIQSKI